MHQIPINPGCEGLYSLRIVCSPFCYLLSSLFHVNTYWLPKAWSIISREVAKSNPSYLSLALVMICSCIWSSNFQFVAIDMIPPIQVDLLEPVSHFLDTARVNLAPENLMVTEDYKAVNFFCVPLQVICSPFIIEFLGRLSTLRLTTRRLYSSI